MTSDMGHTVHTFKCKSLLRRKCSLLSQTPSECVVNGRVCAVHVGLWLARSVKVSMWVRRQWDLSVASQMQFVDRRQFDMIDAYTCRPFSQLQMVSYHQICSAIVHSAGLMTSTDHHPSLPPFHHQLTLHNVHRGDKSLALADCLCQQLVIAVQRALARYSAAPWRIVMI